MTKTIKYDLEERAAKFGEDIIVFVRKIQKDVERIPRINPDFLENYFIFK